MASVTSWPFTLTRWLPAAAVLFVAGIAMVGIRPADALLQPAYAWAMSLALIGLFNVFGTYAAGALGQRMPKKNILAGIYFARALVIAIFISVPLSPLSVYIFSAVMGAMWLATVPLTSGLVAHIYGIRYMGTLYGFVFLSHQLGSFLGVWLGGAMYDLTGDYTMVWRIGIGVGAWLAFSQGWNGVGIWVGLASGLGIVAILMLVRWSLRARLGLLPSEA